MGGRQNQKTRKLVVGLVLVVLGAYAVITGIIGATDSIQPLVAPSGSLHVEVVDTDELRTKGLSGRETLSDNEGMLFVFEEPSERHCLWMKDMVFAVDMIWLDGDKRVLNSVVNVAPDTYPETFCPDGQASYALEVRSGRAQELGLDEGVLVRF